MPRAREAMTKSQVAASIGAVVAGLPRDVVSRVIVVDGSSSDGTRERAKDAGAEVIAVGRGYGLACLTGAQAAANIRKQPPSRHQLIIHIGSAGP